MVENRRNLCHFPYVDNAIFQPSKIKLVLLMWRLRRSFDCCLFTKSIICWFSDNIATSYGDFFSVLRIFMLAFALNKTYYAQKNHWGFKIWLGLPRHFQHGEILTQNPKYDETHRNRILSILAFPFLMLIWARVSLILSYW